MCALGPLVPGVDEQQRRLAARERSSARTRQPAPERERVRTVEDIGRVTTPRRVVPAGHDARMDAEPVRPGRREVCTVDRSIVGVDVARVARRHPGGEVLDRLEPDSGERRELHEAVDHALDAVRQPLEMAGMADREDVQAAEAVVACTLLPAFDRRSAHS